MSSGGLETGSFGLVLGMFPKWYKSLVLCMMRVGGVGQEDSGDLGRELGNFAECFCGPCGETS